MNVMYVGMRFGNCVQQDICPKPVDLKASALCFGLHELLRFHRNAKQQG